MFAFDVALGRVDAGEGQIAVFSNGNDHAPQPMIAYALRERGPSPFPAWMSDDCDHHGGAALGDIDGSGGDALLVSVMCDRVGRTQPDLVGVKLYPNIAGVLSATSIPFPIEDRGPAHDLELADLNGDGLLDLVVLWGPGPSLSSARARVCIYQNPGGPGPWRRFELALPPGMSAPSRVECADMTGNGWLDLVLACDRPLVLYGSIGGDLSLFGREHWRGTITTQWPAGISVAPRFDATTGAAPPVRGRGPAMLLATTRHSLSSDGEARSEVVVYDYPRSTPIARRAAPPLPSALRLVDLRGSGHPGVIVGGIGMTDEPASAMGACRDLAGLHTTPMLYYPGGPEGLARSPSWTSERPMAAQAQALYNYAHGAEKVVAYRFPHPASALTLPTVPIADSVQVRIDGRGPCRFHCAPDRTWLTLRSPAPAGALIELRYRAAARSDLLVADADPRVGNGYFRSHQHQHQHQHQH